MNYFFPILFGVTVLSVISVKNEISEKDYEILCSVLRICSGMNHQKNFNLKGTLYDYK